MEKWSKYISDEYDPKAPSDWGIVYKHDPCGASSCRIWDKFNPISDCLEAFYDPELWRKIGSAPMWDENNQLTKAYWDEYHANGGETDEVEEEWYEGENDNGEKASWEIY